MNDIVKNDLDLISKELYLESPGLWIDFSDKVGENIFDEFVLYIASRYDYPSIIEYALKNNLIDLNDKSKNSNFNTISEHLINTAKNNNSKKVLNLILNNNDSCDDCSDINKLEENLNSETDKYIPSFTCTNCNSNILEKGYKIIENKTLKYSTKDDKIIEVKKDVLDTVICVNCNEKLNVKPEKLEVVCTINNCSSCKTDLRKVGIITKNQMTYDENTNTFKTENTGYVCSNCNSYINNNQKEYFLLK